MYRYNFNGYSSQRFNFYVARISCNDQLINEPGNPTNSQWYRYIRNLNFYSPITEISTQFEINIMRYEIGRRRYRFAPYGFIGVGAFYFNPKTKDVNGNVYKLRELRTEGQGFKEYPDRKQYSLIQGAALIGFGFKYNISENWSLGFEYGHRLTTTDYLDDVSKSYVDPNLFMKNSDLYNGNATASKAYELSRRSMEVNNPDYSSVIDRSTRPGEQRGDPSDYDSYVFNGVITLTYTVSKGKIYCPKF
jgi:hypothetical protein